MFSLLVAIWAQIAYAISSNTNINTVLKQPIPFCGENAQERQHIKQ